MFIVDSNIIISYFREGEERHMDAKNFLDTLSEFAITEHVLSELATILLLKSGMEVVRGVMDFFSENSEVQILRLTEEEFAETLAMFVSQKRKASFVDVSLMILAKNHGYRLATMDQELSKTAKELFPKK